MDLLVPDYIDPTVNDALASEISQETHTSSSSTMLPAVAQVDPQPPVVPSVAVPPTIVIDDDVTSEDISLHGSSIMDEENDDLIEFRDILDGYDYISSADDEIQDTDIEDVAPMVSNTGPVIISTDSTDTELEDTLASPQFFLETGFIPSIDERNSEPDTELPEASLLPVTAPTASTSSATKCDSDMVEVNEVISSSLPVVPSVTHATIPIPVPSSRFSFKAPTRITVATFPAVPSSVNSSLKPLNLSSRLPPSLLSTSSDAPVTSSNTSNTRSDVQGRTSVSKEGDVGLDSAFSTEEDMEVSKNWNKNKRKQFKPVTPKRDKKRRIFYVIEIYNRK